MIRIQLMREGRVVKQITSRVHESVILEQIEKYQDAYDTVAIVEGELSEDAKQILQKVAKKIIPAAMAAGVALGGSNAAAQTNNRPGTDYSIGQHVADIFHPNYKEIRRQREYERETKRREWNAQQNEIRRARIDAAKEAGRQSVGATNQKIYDQSRVSQDGKWFILYGMDDSITRIPTKGAEFMPADSQRMAHYISAGGRVYYVRHPHNDGLGESVIAEGRPGHEEFDKGYSDAQRGIDNNPYNPNSPAYNQYREGQQAFKRHVGESLEEGIGTIGTVGTIPASGGSMTKKTEFSKTGDSTDVKFNAQGQLELDDELDDDAIDTLKKAGVEVAESRMSELDQIIQDNARAVEEFKRTGILDDANLESDLHYFFYDQLSPQAQRDADDEGEIADLFAEALGIDLANIGESVVKEDAELDAILDQFPEAWDAFKAGGDLDDNPDFYEALFNYYADSGEMPYGTQKARDGDPIQWISAKLDDLAGNHPMGEAAEDDEATPADIAGADKNIIMQLRKAKDYEKPTVLELADGATVRIDSSVAAKILSLFDGLRPDSKALMQQTLNSNEGFHEILNYLNEREVLESMADIDLISNHMKPVLEARNKARNLIKSVFGKV